MEEIEAKLKQWLGGQTGSLSELGSPSESFSLLGTIGLDVAVDRDGRVWLNEWGSTSDERASWRIATPEERVLWLRRWIAGKK